MEWHTETVLVSGPSFAGDVFAYRSRTGRKEADEAESDYIQAVNDALYT